MRSRPPAPRPLPSWSVAAAHGEPGSPATGTVPAAIAVPRDPAASPPATTVPRRSANAKRPRFHSNGPRPKQAVLPPTGRPADSVDRERSARNWRNSSKSTRQPSTTGANRPTPGPHPYRWPGRAAAGSGRSVSLASVENSAGRDARAKERQTGRPTGTVPVPELSDSLLSAVPPPMSKQFGRNDCVNQLTAAGDSDSRVVPSGPRQPNTARFQGVFRQVDVEDGLSK